MSLIIIPTLINLKKKNKKKKKGKHDGEKSFNWCGKSLELSAKMTVKVCPWVGEIGKLLLTSIR